MFGHQSFLVLGSIEGVNITSLIKEGYEILDCNFSFQQGIDQKGKATTRVHAGTFSITLSQLPPLEITEWALNSRRYHQGVIVVLNEENIPMEKILFENAACVGYEILYTQGGNSYASTKLTLQAEKITVGSGIEFDNEWTD